MRDDESRREIGSEDEIPLNTSMHTFTSIKQNPDIVSDYKSRDMVPLSCVHCGREYGYPKNRCQLSISAGRVNNFCSTECSYSFRNRCHDVICKNCGTSFKKRNSDVKKSPTHFCSRSCSGTYNAKHRTHGTRRSKIEEWLEDELTKLYPHVNFHFNRKDAIGSELDIYVPSVQLAFEINGIFHYQPIYGDMKLEQIQQNDEDKKAACIENDIKLYSIDVSTQTHFTPESSVPYLEAVREVIEDQLSPTSQ